MRAKWLCTEFTLGEGGQGKAGEPSRQRLSIYRMLIIKSESRCPPPPPALPPSPVLPASRCQSSRQTDGLAADCQLRAGCRWSCSFYTEVENSRVQLTASRGLLPACRPLACLLAYLPTVPLPALCAPGLLGSRPS